MSCRCFGSTMRLPPSPVQHWFYSGFQENGFWHVPRIAVCISPKLRCLILLRGCFDEPKNKKIMIHRIAGYASVTYSALISPNIIFKYVEWFWLYQIKNNSQDAIFEELLYQLYESPRTGNSFLLSKLMTVLLFFFIGSENLKLQDHFQGPLADWYAGGRAKI